MHLAADVARLTRRARLAMGLLVAIAVFHLVMLVLNLDAFATYSAVENGAGLTRATSAALRSRSTFGTTAWFGLTVVTAAAFIQWLGSAAAVARGLTSENRVPYSTSDVAWAWMVPAANLVRPYTIVSDVWVAADPDEFEAPQPPIESGGAAYRGTTPRPAVIVGRAPPIGLWWAAYMVVPCAMAMVSSQRASESGSEMLKALLPIIFISATDLVAAVCILFVITAIQRDLLEKARRVASAAPARRKPASDDLAMMSEAAAHRQLRGSAGPKPWWIALACTAVATAIMVVGVRARTASYATTSAAESVRERYHLDPASAAHVGNALNQIGSELRNDPETRGLVERLGRHEPAAVAAMVRGMSMLPPDRLAEVNRIRIRLANASPEVCSSLWSGQNVESNTIRALATLDDASMQRFIAVQIEAIRLGASDAGAPEIDPMATRNAVRAIAAGLPPERRAAFEAAVAARQNVTPQAGCAAYLELATGLDGLPQDLRVGALRAMFARGPH